jgi:putative colanic acid biosysnthesis UDP-glucose lipid carrier transferase
MSKSEAALSAEALVKRPVPAPIGRDNILGSIESLVGPSALVFSLWALALYYFDGQLPPPVLILSVLVFALTFPGPTHLQSTLGRVMLDIAFNWAWIAGLMFAMGIATGYIREFTRDMLLTWLWVAPTAEFGLHLLLRAAAPAILRLQGPNQRALIVGMNEQGTALARRLAGAPYSRVDLVGFVDSRAKERLPSTDDYKLLGKLDQLAEIAKEQHVQLIYLSLPMASQPRILQLLDDL